MALRVMIVDDIPYIRKLLKEIIDSFEFQLVAEASNGLEAIELAKKHKPDLIIMDIVMPKLSGIDATKEIRKFCPQSKIVMCSSLGQDPIIKESLKAGASDFIVKPFEAKDVIKLIKKVVQPK